MPFGYAEWADRLRVLCVILQFKVMYAAMAARLFLVVCVILLGIRCGQRVRRSCVFDKHPLTPAPLPLQASKRVENVLSDIPKPMWGRACAW
jgi:hypothetical protein